MIPGLNTQVAARLAAMLGQKTVTDVTADGLSGLPYTVLSPGDAALAALGITVDGRPELTILVTDPTRRVGQVHIQASGTGGVVVLDNRASGANLHANLRLLGSDSLILFSGLADGYIALPDVFLRSNGQLLFWGNGATCVGASIEIEGDGRSVVIGDDALMSSGIWIRNHDMHAVHDLASNQPINRPAVDTILERHVWLGQNAMLHMCELIGRGAIVGAMSLVKGVVGECVAVGGVPARILRYQVSWGRALQGMTDAERATISQE